MEYNNLIVEVKEDIGWIKMNRPQALNALNTETLSELEKAVESLDKNESVKVLVITGEGKAFVAGADITEMQDMDSSAAINYSQTGHRVFLKIEHLEKPVIAAINGFALGGGCELAMACDLRIASEKAKFGQPEVGLGIIPGYAGTQRLSRTVGIGKAKELIFTGDMIDAATALSIGLVNTVVPADNLFEEAESVAKKIASKGPIAIRKAKSVINRGFDTDLQTGCSYETEAFGECFITGQPKEGMSAFLEKRTPKW